jgi:hypothetical protein
MNRGTLNVGERLLGLDWFWPHPVDGAVDRGSSDAEEFSEFAWV